MAGVECEDGTRYQADVVLLAAGALHSPRLLQAYLEEAGLADRLPAYRNVGRNYKFHVLTAMLAFTPAKVEDVLSKTMLLTHDALPHSTVQTLGGNLAAEILRTQAPRWVPGAVVEPFARRAIGLFLQTEDGSHPDNRVLVPQRIACAPADRSRSSAAAAGLCRASASSCARSGGSCCGSAICR